MTSVKGQSTPKGAVITLETQPLSMTKTSTSGDWVEAGKPVRETMEAKAYWETGEWSNLAGIKEVQSES